MPDITALARAEAVAVGAVPKAAPASEYNEVDAAIYAAAFARILLDHRADGYVGGTAAGWAQVAADVAAEAVDLHRA